MNRLSRQGGVGALSGSGLQHLGEGAAELSDTFLERVGMLLGKIYAGNAGKRIAVVWTACNALSPIGTPWSFISLFL